MIAVMSWHSSAWGGVLGVAESQRSDRRGVPKATP